MVHIDIGLGHLYLPFKLIDLLCNFCNLLLVFLRVDQFPQIILQINEAFGKCSLIFDERSQILFFLLFGRVNCCCLYFFLVILGSAGCQYKKKREYYCIKKRFAMDSLPVIQKLLLEVISGAAGIVGQYR